VSFEGAFHGRTLGALAVTHRKRHGSAFDIRLAAYLVSVAKRPRPRETERREQRSLKQLWETAGVGRLPHADKNVDTFAARCSRSTGSSPKPGGDVQDFVEVQRALLTPDVMKRSRRVAAVLVEPIQGEGGVRLTTRAVYAQAAAHDTRLRCAVDFRRSPDRLGDDRPPLAHELFDLPCPPDAVTWAKKAQNGILFCERDTRDIFSKREKKFNTTWEGDSVGMVRLLAGLDRLDLDLVRPHR